MVKTASKRAWVALSIVVVLMLTFCGAAFAAQPDTTPNSGASHNCVATSSGVLYYRQHNETHLGQDVGMFASGGRQGEWVQGVVHNTC